MNLKVQSLLRTGLEASSSWLPLGKQKTNLSFICSSLPSKKLDSCAGGKSGLKPLAELVLLLDLESKCLSNAKLLGLGLPCLEIELFFLDQVGYKNQCAVLLCASSLGKWKTSQHKYLSVETKKGHPRRWWVEGKGLSPLSTGCELPCHYKDTLLASSAQVLRLAFSTFPFLLTAMAVSWASGALQRMVSLSFLDPNSRLCWLLHPILLMSVMSLWKSMAISGMGPLSMFWGWIVTQASPVHHSCLCSKVAQATTLYSSLPPATLSLSTPWVDDVEYFSLHIWILGGNCYKPDSS